MNIGWFCLAWLFSIDKIPFTSQTRQGSFFYLSSSSFPSLSRDFFFYSFKRIVTHFEKKTIYKGKNSSRLDFLHYHDNQSYSG